MRECRPSEGDSCSMCGCHSGPGGWLHACAVCGGMMLCVPCAADAVPDEHALPGAAASQAYAATEWDTPTTAGSADSAPGPAAAASSMPPQLQRPLQD
eukprot:3682750-Alexandrium_andersonii.AAC.1